MSVWHQACSVDGKIRSFEVSKETLMTLTLWSASKQKEVVLNKRREGTFCSPIWLVAHGWLVQKTHDDLVAARKAFADVHRKHSRLQSPDDITAMFAARRMLSNARSVHGNAKGLKERP